MINNLPPRGSVPTAPEAGDPAQGKQQAQGANGYFYGPNNYPGFQQGPVPGQPYYVRGVKQQGFPVWGWFAIIGGAIILFVAGLVTAILIFVFNLPNVTESFGSTTYFYNSLQRHDYESAQRMLSSELAGKYAIVDLKTQWEALEKANGGNLSMDITNFNITNDAATFSITLKGSNGKTYSLKVNLHSTSGNTWRITDASPGLIPTV